LLCEIIGGACSLSAGVSRGCRSGPGAARVIAPEVFDEVAALLETIDRAPPDERRRAAARVAELIRREARDNRNLLGLARADELEFVPQLAALCRRRC
jgi:hypothetical protein